MPALNSLDWLNRLNFEANEQLSTPWYVLVAALKNMAFMGASTGIRLVFGLLTFTLLARTLGPNAFGVLMLWFSIATLLSMLANYGFTPYLLKEIGSTPENAQQIMGEVLSAKILLSLSVLILGVCALPLVTPSSYSVFLLLVCALLTESMTEFLNVGFRATNRFGEETRVATIAAVLQFAIIAMLLMVQSGITAAASAYLISRLLVLLLTWYVQRRYFSALKPGSLAQALHRIRTTVSYAMDFGLQSLFGQIDSLVLNHFIGPVAVGIYQAGLKLFMAGAQAANVLSNVLIPHVASSISDADDLQIKTNRMVSSFAFFGICGYLSFLLIPRKLVIFIFGSNFEALSGILTPLGILFLVRFCAAGIGLVLTIKGMQRLRTICTFIHWISIALCVAIFGVAAPEDWIRWLIVGNLILTLSYLGVSLFRAGFRPKGYCVAALGTACLFSIGWLI